MNGEVIHYESPQMNGTAPVIHSQRTMMRVVLNHLQLDAEQHTVKFVHDNKKSVYRDGDTVYAVVNIIPNTM